MSDPRAAARVLHAARRARERLTSLSPELAPRTEAEAAAARRALAELAREVGPEAAPVGFKIGATAPRMQAYLGLDGPAAGFMGAAGIHESGARLPHAQFVAPGVECELAVRLAEDLPPGPCTPERAASAVATLFPAIEIVDNRYGDLVRLGTPTLIADQVFHAGAVLGAPSSGTDWRALDMTGLTGRISVDGTVRDQGRAADLMGHPIRCLAWLAGSQVTAAFGGLRKGQVIMLGSVTPPVWLPGPARVEVAFDEFSPVLFTFM
ncbi:MAG: 2-keto-4-pentenoate hydratase [Geminicoccaceae bacterium]